MMMNTAHTNRAIAALQTRYLWTFALIGTVFVLVYVAYLMGFINYFHGWLMRLIVVAFLLAAATILVRYYRERSRIQAPPASVRRR
jgi:Na+-driven multidrug efflux pump